MCLSMTQHPRRDHFSDVLERAMSFRILEWTHPLSLIEHKTSLMLGLFQGPRPLNIGKWHLTWEHCMHNEIPLSVAMWRLFYRGTVLPLNLMSLRSEKILFLGDEGHHRKLYFQGIEEPLRAASLISRCVATWLWHMFSDLF